MGLWEWGRRMFLGDLVGRCQLHAPGLPQASWLAATVAPGKPGYFLRRNLGESLEASIGLAV